MKKIIRNLCLLYHVSIPKIKSKRPWKHTFLSHTWHVLYFHCIWGLLQHKNGVNIKYQDAVRALRSSLSFSFPDDCSGLHFSPPRCSWCLPWCWSRMPGYSLVPDSICSHLNPLSWALPWFVPYLAWDCQGALRPVSGAAACGQPPWDWVTLVSQLHIPQGAALLTPLPWHRVLSPFGHIFNKQHGSHWMVKCLVI